MKNKCLKLSVLSLIIVISACSAVQKKQEDNLEKQISNQAPADSPNQIMQRAAMAFSNAEGLSAEQKLKLSGVYSRVYSESMQIRREIGQSKSLLFMTLAKVDYKNSEIKKLKKKIVALDQKRLTLMFAALDEVQIIVGKGIEAEKIYKHFQDYEYPNPNHRVREYQF